MNIVIMSDTHFSQGFSLDSAILKHISDAEMIIHCGDFTSPEFYNFLKTSKKLVAVRGNNDHKLADMLGTEEKIELEGFKIVIIHGHYVRLENLHRKYSDSDIIVFGHTHHPSIENIEEQLIINPGSLTSNRYIDYNTFMVLNLNAGQKPVVNIFKTL